MKQVYFSLFFLFCFTGFTQELVVQEEEEPLYREGWEFSGEVNVRGMLPSGDALPFWMYSNQRGRVYEDTNLAAWVTGRLRYNFDEDNYFEAAAGGLYRDGAPKELIDDEIYLHYENPWLRATIGRKHRPIVYNGLSASNENILWSLNARPLPGVQLGTNGIVYFEEDNLGFGAEASWEEYRLGEDRYMENARLHHKSLYLAYQSEGGFQVKAGAQHFAHYGGTDPQGREWQFTQNYWDAVTMEHPSQHHLSSYELYLGQDFNDFRLEFLYNHIAVDRSGRLLSNTPDGRYGIYYETHDRRKFINSMIYELYTTHNQSQTSTWGGDDYFNHFRYKSGWAYEGKILGAPLFTYDIDNQRVINNKFTAHHIGIGGQISDRFVSYPYKLLLTYASNEGAFYNRFPETQNVFYTYLEARVFQNFVDLNLILATEHNSSSSPKYGIGVQVGRQF